MAQHAQPSEVPGPAAAAPPRRRHSRLRFYGDEFLFNTASGLFYRLSPTASFILRALDAGTTPADLAAALQQRYGVDRATALRDIELCRNDIAAFEPAGEPKP